jgi:hypothetical protein
MKEVLQGVAVPRTRQKTYVRRMGLHLPARRETVHLATTANAAQTNERADRHPARPRRLMEIIPG